MRRLRTTRSATPIAAAESSDLSLYLPDCLLALFDHYGRSRWANSLQQAKFEFEGGERLERRIVKLARNSNAFVGAEEMLALGPAIFEVWGHGGSKLRRTFPFLHLEPLHIQIGHDRLRGLNGRFTLPSSRFADSGGSAVKLPPVWRVEPVVDDDARDALRAASQHFVELTRILDEAIAKARGVRDDELLERLARAKSAADQGEILIAKIEAILADDAGQDCASLA